MDFNDNIVCPNCGEADDEHCEYPRGLNYDGDEDTHMCSYCGEWMTVTLCATFTYGASPVDEKKKVEDDVP